MSARIDLARHIRSVPDFPIPGILFRDITPLLAHAQALKQAVAEMSEPWAGGGVTVVAAMEARGFIFGGAMAVLLGAGFVPVRKAGKLPWKTNQIAYSLEYRNDVLHIHQDAVSAGARVLVVDDVIATGGTSRAVVDLVEQMGATVVGIQFLIELTGLAGRELLEGYEVRSLMEFEGD